MTLTKTCIIHVFEKSLLILVFFIYISKYFIFYGKLRSYLIPHFNPLLWFKDWFFSESEEWIIFWPKVLFYFGLGLFFLDVSKIVGIEVYWKINQKFYLKTYLEVQEKLKKNYQSWEKFYYNPMIGIFSVFTPITHKSCLAKHYFTRIMLHNKDFKVNLE